MPRSRSAFIVGIVLALVVSGASIPAAGAAKKKTRVAKQSGPVTKQNGKTPAFENFTSICAVPGYVNYGNCNGDSTTYTEVAGRINAVQAKAGIWNLGFSFTHLQPGATYRLWGNRSTTQTAGDNSGFFVIGTTVAALDGTAKFSYQTSSPTNLGFDLNVLADAWETNGITVVTSYWSNQAIQVLNPDGTLYVPGA